MKKANLVRSIVGLAVVISFANCTFSTYVAYSGPGRAPREIGFLYIPSDAIEVIKVDGIAPKGGALIPGGFPEPLLRRILFLPGQHTITVGYYFESSSRKVFSRNLVTLTFEIVADRTYDLEANETGTSWDPKIKRSYYRDMRL